MNPYNILPATSMDLRIPEETPRYQWHGQPISDPRYQWHGPTNPALVEARRRYVRNSQELAIANANSQKKATFSETL